MLRVVWEASPSGTSELLSAQPHVGPALATVSFSPNFSNGRGRRV